MEKQGTYENILFDSLTGLYNLTGFFEVLRNEAPADPPSFCALYLDVVDFKDFNRNYGFAGGNELLKGIAHEISRIFIDCRAFRSDGDHFGIQIFETDEASIRQRIQELQQSIRQYEKGMHITLKAGIAFSDGTEEDPIFVMDHARMACTHTKHVYDEDICLYTVEFAKKAAFHQYVVGGFHDALKKGYIKTYYQREIRALTGQSCGFEALARWDDPVYGMISPAVFVEALEDAHLVHKLDIYMVHQVCCDIRYVMDRGLEAQPISVNLSRLDFSLCDIFEEVEKSREEFDIPVSMLNIEITESAMAAETTALDREIDRFRQAGYKIWMDDFGSGYSSLNNLKSFHFDVLKIDMNFLREFETNPRARVILASIVNMAKELGIHTLAEGVETAEQYDFLRSIGCEKLQGFLIGKPVPFPWENREEGSEEHQKTDEVFAATKPEPLDMTNYYDRIGEVNVLGSMPLSESKGVIETFLPISIVEVIDDRIVFIYANKSYEKFLEELGIDGLAALNRRAELSGVHENDEFRRLARKAETSGHEELAEVVINGNVCTMRLLFLSRTGNRAAFVMLSRNLSRNAESRQAEDIQTAFRYMLHMFFRVDLFDEDGTVENIYLSAVQKRITDEETDSVRAVRIYVERYIRSDDQERFMQFYDMNTILERVREGGKDYITSRFHAVDDKQGALMQSYTIVPFRFEGRWKMLSCCRNLDEIW